MAFACGSFADSAARPVDLQRFAATVGELERLYSGQYPARSETMRREILDAIARLRRELERDKSYLPTPLQFLETRLQEYKTKSVSQEAVDSTGIVLRAIDRAVELRRDLSVSGPGEIAVVLAARVAEQAALYLETPGIQIPWLTNCILGLSPHERLTGAAGRRIRKSDWKKMELIRREIRARREGSVVSERSPIASLHPAAMR